MNAEWLLQRLAMSVIALAIGTLISAFFIKRSVRLTACMLGTPAPPFSTARTFAVALCLSLMNQLFAVAFDLAGSGATTAGVTIFNVRIPTYWFIARPFESFLLAGLMIRFLPTTVVRGSLVSLNYQVLETALLVVIVTAAVLFG